MCIQASLLGHNLGKANVLPPRCHTSGPSNLELFRKFGGTSRHGRACLMTLKCPSKQATGHEVIRELQLRAAVAQQVLQGLQYTAMNRQEELQRAFSLGQTPHSSAWRLTTPGQIKQVSSDQLRTPQKTFPITRHEGGVDHAQCRVSPGGEKSRISAV